MVRVSLGEVVNDMFFRGIDSVLENIYDKPGDFYFELYFYAYADSMFLPDEDNKCFNSDSLTWILIFPPPRIMFPNDNYLVMYNQFNYLISKNIGNQENLIRPLHKTKRICQEVKFSAYYLFPILLLWHPSGNVVQIPEDTDLFYRIRE